MRKRNLLRVALALLAVGSLLTAASPAWACEGDSCSGFTKDEYEVMEGEGYAELQVRVAWCCPTAQGTIDYETSDLTAIADQDYRQTSGTLTFTGHGGASIRIPIFFDDFTEGEEQFEVRLTNFRGTFVNRGRETAVVKIVDDHSKRFSSDPVQLGPPDQQAAGSQGGSSTPRSPSTNPASPADSGNPSVNPAGPTPTMADEDLGEESERVVARAAGGDNPSPPVGSAGLRALLVVMIAAAVLGLKMKFGRKLTER
ncbi:MAG: hypothetical protein KY429_00935 [Actinobacteria bacterium]|nr:hypothetical protein [Actinomycetota bacterium]